MIGHVEGCLPEDRVDAAQSVEGAPCPGCRQASYRVVTDPAGLSPDGVDLTDAVTAAYASPEMAEALGHFRHVIGCAESEVGVARFADGSCGWVCLTCQAIVHAGSQSVADNATEELLDYCRAGDRAGFDALAACLMPAGDIDECWAGTRLRLHLDPGPPPEPARDVRGVGIPCDPGWTIRDGLVYDGPRAVGVLAPDGRVQGWGQGSGLCQYSEEEIRYILAHPTTSVATIVLLRARRRRRVDRGYPGC